jgi:transcriptional regulator with XRE-family HTH domain
MLEHGYHSARARGHRLKHGYQERFRASVPKHSDRADPALGAALLAIRKKANRSQEDVAIRAGTTSGTLARIELAQTSPEWRTVRSLAAELGVSLRQLAIAVESPTRRLRRSAASASVAVMITAEPVISPLCPQAGAGSRRARRASARACGAPRGAALPRT